MKLRSKLQVREKIQTVLNMLDEINNTLKLLEELGALDGIPDNASLNDNIKQFQEKLTALELIKKAIAVGVLQAAGSERVYVAMRDKDDEYWAPLLLEDAALSLVDTGNVETLREAVETAQKESND